MNTASPPIRPLLAEVALSLNEAGSSDSSVIIASRTGVGKLPRVGAVEGTIEGGKGIVTEDDRGTEVVGKTEEIGGDKGTEVGTAEDTIEEVDNTDVVEHEKVTA